MKRIFIFILILSVASILFAIDTDDFDSNIPVYWELSSSNDDMDYFDIGFTDLEGKVFPDEKISFDIPDGSDSASAKVYLEWRIITAKIVKLYIKTAGPLKGQSYGDSIPWSIKWTGGTASDSGDEVLVRTHNPAVSCVSSGKLEMSFETEALDTTKKSDVYEGTVSIVLRVG